VLPQFTEALASESVVEAKNWWFILATGFFAATKYRLVLL
jgi:hypothetical protein